MQAHLKALEPRRAHYKSKLPAGKATIVKEGGATLFTTRVLLPDFNTPSILARITRRKSTDQRAGDRHQPAYSMRDVSA